MQSYFPGSDDAQALASAMRDLDGFNWGCATGELIALKAYASSSEGIAGLKRHAPWCNHCQRSVLVWFFDVVNRQRRPSSGIWEKSNIDKLVPGYYHRYNEVSGTIERSTCCENTATEHVVMDKFVSDSLVILARDFGYDSFRFDVMGHMPKSSILAAREAVGKPTQLR